MGKDWGWEKYYAKIYTMEVTYPSTGSPARFSQRLIAHVLTSMLTFSVITFTNHLETFPLTQLAILFVFIAFNAWCWKYGLTPGKYIMQQRVYDISGNVAGFWRMAYREIIGKFISGLSLGIGFLWAIFDHNHQTWHDLMAKTIVVEEHHIDVKV